LRVNIPAKEKGQEWDGVYLEDITSYFDNKKIEYISTYNGPRNLDTKNGK